METFSRIMHATSQRLIWLGILLAVLSWFVESFMHARIFSDPYADLMSSILFPDRHELWMRLIIVVLFISFAGYVQRIVKALKKAEKTIQHINMELMQIFNTAADGMRVIDQNFNMLRFNKTFLRLVDAKAEDVQGRKCYDVFWGSACHTDQCPMLRIQKGEELIEYDAMKISLTGNHIPCIVTATPFRGYHGDFVGIVEDFKDISDRKRAQEELQHSHEQLRIISSRLEMAREQERRSMAREIHDQLGQSLTGMKMDLHWLSRSVPEHGEQFQEKLLEMNRQLDQTIHTVQRLSSELRPCLLDDLGLSAAIEWHAGKVRDQLGIEFDIVSIPEDITLGETSSITVYRIFQEALTNIARHSGATQVEILLQRSMDRVTLTVKDNGRGFPKERIHATNSFGIIGMQERACLLHGSLEIQSKSGQGTTIFLSIPYHGGQNHVADPHSR